MTIGKLNNSAWPRSAAVRGTQWRDDSTVLGPSMRQTWTDIVSGTGPVPSCPPDQLRQPPLPADRPYDRSLGCNRWRPRLARHKNVKLIDRVQKEEEEEEENKIENNY